MGFDENPSPLLPLDVLARDAGFDPPDAVSSPGISPEKNNGMASINIQRTERLLWPKSDKPEDRDINKPGTFPGYHLQEPLHVAGIGRVYGYIPKTRTFIFSPDDNPFDRAFCSSFALKTGLVGAKNALQTKLFVNGEEALDDPIEAVAARMSLSVREKTRSIIDGTRSLMQAGKGIYEKLRNGFRGRFSSRLGSERTESDGEMMTQQTVELSEGVTSVIPQTVSE